MRIDFGGISTASLGAMLEGYGVMAGVGAAWTDARFWWTPAGALTAEIGEFDECERSTACEAVRDHIFKLVQWASDTGTAFEKTRKNTRKKIEGGDPPLKTEATWDSLEEALAVDAEGAGVFAERIHRSNPVLANWGQDGSVNLFSVLSEAGKEAKPADISKAVFGGDTAPSKRLTKGSGVLFPEGIKRYATGSVWVHEKKKPLGLWDFILAMRGLLLLRGAVRSPRGSRRGYPAFPFIFPGSVRAQGSAVETDEVFLPTWSRDRLRTLAEFQAQVRSFQARVGRRDFVSGAADFRRAVAGRAVTGAFDAFHRFALEPRKPGKQSPQNQAVSRGVTTVGPASAARDSLRLLLAPLDDSAWIENFRLPRSGGKAEKNSEKLALAKTRFDEAVHAAIDARGNLGDTGHVAVLEALWKLQLKLWEVSDPERFKPAPLLKGHAWRRVLSELLEKPAARLGWALASLGWRPVQDDDGWEIKMPVVEQLLPVQCGDKGRLSVPDPPPAHRVPQPGRNPDRELAALFWRRWLDTASLPMLPARGTRPADAADVAALLCGDVDVKEMQRYFLAFLLLDGSGGAPPRPPASVNRPSMPSYAALRLWFELSARPMQGERRPMDGAVPRGIATGTSGAVESACRAALHRLRIAGLPGCRQDDIRPGGKNVSLPNVVLTAPQARLMAAAVLIPVNEESVEGLAGSLLVPSPSRESKHQTPMETAHV